MLKVAQSIKQPKIVSRNALGPALRRKREVHGWSQADVAAKLQREGWSVDRTLIAKIESRRRCITDYELILLTRVLKTSITELAVPLKKSELLKLTHSEN